MNKRFVVAWVVLFVAWMISGFVVHETLLKGDYLAISHLFRPEAEAAGYFGWMVLAHVLMAGAFVWIYARGVEDRPWLGQGLRFGFAVSLLAAAPIYLIYYAVQPLPGALVAKQIVFETVGLLVLGALVAFLSRDGKRA